MTYRNRRMNKQRNTELLIWHWYIAECPKCHTKQIIKTKDIEKFVLKCKFCGKSTQFMSLRHGRQFDVIEVPQKRARAILLQLQNKKRKNNKWILGDDDNVKL